jgi:hypothetical protein
MGSVGASFGAIYCVLRHNYYPLPQTVDNYLAIVTIAAAILWIR